MSLNTRLGWGGEERGRVGAGLVWCGVGGSECGTCSRRLLFYWGIRFSVTVWSHPRLPPALPLLDLRVLPAVHTAKRLLSHWVCVCCTCPRYRIVGQIFTYTFIALFIYVVLNVFIAIIEESFFTVVQRGKEMVEEMRWA